MLFCSASAMIKTCILGFRFSFFFFLSIYYLKNL